MKRDRPPSTSESNGRKLRLLLHAVDGCVPYMTPSTLEQLFPPSNNDSLWIGLAVRDTCVTPVFEDKKKKKKDKKSKGKDNDAKPESKATEPPLHNKKPTGYSFLPTSPDPWLLPYNRITVPTFDPIADNNAKGSYTCTNKGVSMWTPHGRQKMTPEEYNDASLALDAQYTLSLYDINDEGSARRQQKAEQRNKEWFEALVTKLNCQSGSSSTSNNSSNNSSTTHKETKLWVPALIPNDASAPLAIAPSPDTHKASGIALIGKWHNNNMESLLQGLEYDNVAMLSTHSLQEILDIASGSSVVNMIGTNLPQEWAKKKLALAIDLHYDSNSSSKRFKGGTGDDHEEENDRLDLDSNGCIDLSSKVFERDARPLVPNSTSVACQHSMFSRAYIHHLVVAQEILAEILLFAHNLHQLLELFRAFRETPDPMAFREFIQKQLPPRES